MSVSNLGERQLRAAPDRLGRIRDQFWSKEKAKHVVYGLAAFMTAMHPNRSSALVFGPDDRIAVPSNPGSLFAPIGLVYDRTTGRRTSGFLVSKCHALTARHLLRDDGSGDSKSLEYWANVSGDPSRWKTTRARIVAGGDGTLGVQNDWMLLRLDRCLGKEFGAIRFPKRSPTVGELIGLAGYPIDRSFSDGVIFSQRCRIRDVKNGLALHDCDLQPGNSGSPLFRVINVRGEARLELVAMHVRGHSYGVPGASLILPVTAYYPNYANVALLPNDILSDNRVQAEMSDARIEGFARSQ